MLLSSGAAFADGSGVASAGAGLYIDGFGNDDSWTGSALEAAASGVYDFTPEFGVQVDGALHRRSVDYGYYDQTLTEFDGALHGFFRNDQFLVGGFVQVGKTAFDYSSGAGSDWGRAYAGVEAEAYLDNVTLYGQLGVSDLTLEDTPDYDVKSWFITAELRYFLTDNLRLDVHGGLDKTSFEGDEQMTTYNFGVGAEYRLDDSPVSLYGTIDFQNNDLRDFETQGLKVIVGAKFNFGDDTLKDRDRTGPSLKLVTPSFLYNGTT